VTRRTRRAIGSSDGARLLANPAGLSRSENTCGAKREAGALDHFFQIAPAKIGQVSRMSAPFQERPSKRACHEAALGTCTTRPVRR
jgi:hypothetical protein